MWYEWKSVHPRVCGEQLRDAEAAEFGVGSSPRVRGTVTHTNKARRIKRFIPACAGNSGYAQARASVNAVHPRVCGEQKT